MLLGETASSSTSSFSSSYMKMETENKKMKMKQRAVVLYPSPGRAHLNPVVELAKLILKEEPSLSITIITSSLPPHSSDLISYASKFSSKSIHFVHLQALIISNTTTITAVATASSDSGDASLAIREYVASLFETPKLNNPALHDTLLSLSQTYDIRAFIMDYFCCLASQVASSLDLPTYYLRSHGALGMAIFLYLSSIDKSISKSLKDLDPNFMVEFPGVPPIPCKDMAVVFIDRDHRVYHLIVEGSAKLAKCKGIIANTFDALEPSILKTIQEGKCTPGEPNVPPVYCVGPLMTPIYDAGGGEDDGCITWLDNHPSRSVLFLCFGRSGIFSSHQLKEMAVGLERSGVRFLWVVRNPPDQTSSEDIVLETLFPQGFLERTKERGLVVKKWAPQFQVLSHGSVGGFLTHCGWSSVMEAVCAGVPMLTWPLYAEQKMNRVYLVDGLKVALGIKEDDDGWVSADELEEKVTEFMNSEKGVDMRKQAALMKQAASKALSDRGSSRVAIAKLVQSFIAPAI